MSKGTAAFLGLCFVGLVLTTAEQTSTSSAKEQTEVKISQSHRGGKYKRVTETFADKTLVARKEEVSLKDNGKIDYVFEKLFRAGEMTFSSTFYKAEGRTIRSFYNHGKMLVEEGDEDGDGFFETMILFDQSEKPVEAFIKAKDGTVEEFSQSKLDELRKSFAKLH